MIKKISKEFMVKSWDGRDGMIKQKKKITLGLGWNGIGFEKEWHWILNLKKNGIGLEKKTFANQIYYNDNKKKLKDSNYIK